MCGDLFFYTENYHPQNIWMNLNDLDDSSELDARELAFGEKFQYPTYRGAPRGTISADAEVLESLNLLRNFGKCGRF